MSLHTAPRVTTESPPGHEVSKAQDSARTVVETNPAEKALAEPRRRVAVIMPAYNEAANIQRAVAAVRHAVPEADIVVISDGSRDATARLARDARALVLELPHNLGIGGAVQTGYKFVAARGYEIVARLDGDGQHNPVEFAALAAPILAGEADLVVGSRYVVAQGADGRATSGEYRASFTRAGGIRYFAWLVSRIIGQRVTDTTSGFQVCNAAVARFCSDNLPCDYPEVETLAVLGRAGFRIREVRVRMLPRLGGRSSITLSRSAYYALKVTLALLVEVMRRPRGREDGPGKQLGVKDMPAGETSAA